MVDPERQLANRHPTHDFIELFQKSTSRIFEICGPLYEKGFALKEISKMTGIPYASIHDQLAANGVAFRPNKSVTTSEALCQGFKTCAPPAYGFYAIDGAIEKHPTEYPVLLIIHQQWQLGQSATAIMHHLNAKKIRTRSQKEWKRTTLLNIIERFENGTLLPERTKK